MFKTTLIKSIRKPEHPSMAFYLCYQMKKLTGIGIFLLLCAFAVSTFSSCHRHEGASNKYREAKVRPSERQAREDKKINKRGNKNYKKQMRRNRKFLFGRSKAPE